MLTLFPLVKTMATKNKLGLFMLIALVTGNMVGSGAFMIPTELARVGSIGLVSLLFTAAGAICLALVFAKMSLLVPKAGGPYAYAYAGFGEYIGFQTAYYYWIAVWIGNAAIVVAAIGYLDVFFPISNSLMAKTLCSIAIIWTLTIINIIGVRFAGGFQIITTILKFSPLAIIGTLGWFYFNPEYLTQNFNVTSGTTLSTFSFAATLTMWLFVGVESATIPTDAVHNPQKNIPLATLIGTGFAAIIYILSNTAIFGMIPTESLATSTHPFATATGIIFGAWGKIFVGLAAIISCLGALNGWMLLSSHIPLAAAYDNLFPKVFGKCNRDGTPVFGLVITSILMTILLLGMTFLDLIQQFELLILIASTTSLVAYFYTSIAEIILLPKNSMTRKNLLHIFVAIIGAVYSFWAILGSSKEIIFYLTAFILLTIPFYALLKWKGDKGPPILLSKNKNLDL